MLDINGGEKSYGVFGQAKTVKDKAGTDVAVTEPIYGITSDFRSMTALPKVATPPAVLSEDDKKFNLKIAEQCVGEKYMAVTILPSFDKTDTHDPLKITLGAYEWGDYKRENRFSKPKEFSTTGDTSYC